mmetsp:Transcript_8684/g.8206  ORF Transcript_8684/g.8206 Transcript_8684/m.8206 type:complete len:129 (+) Transcript_8684:758-1144(+)|eukprot:CAMPEP_0197001830 /NCGR_PEP_ID=MMETSP1380-20130617/6441_1 /TAXON_ID=5936 /ORGANISM="Euplotes crassus, Strain CT5" /LENGTH=128 /DNA_ID=CAMNT_0042419661 /DNA_START=758 /DNA_END=1144 /DNA_ORIENTATION=+
MDELVKSNQKTKGEKSNISKFELTSEFKGSQIEKISEKFLTEDEDEKDCHEGMDTQEETSNAPSKMQQDRNILQIPERCQKGGSLLIPSSHHQDGQILFIHKSDPNEKVQPRDELKKLAGSFNGSVLN